MILRMSINAVMRIGFVAALVVGAVRTAQAGAVQIELAIEKSSGTEMRVMSGQKTVDKNYVPKRRAPRGDGFLSGRHIVVKALDERGKVLYTRTELDPRMLHYDDFMNPASGKKQAAKSGKIVEIDSKILMNIPDNPAIASIQIFKPVWNGKRYDLVLLTSGSMPKKGASNPADGPEIKIQSVRGAGECTVTTIRSNGKPSERVDIVLIGDGYTASQMKIWAQDAEKVASELFRQEPFKTYQKYFNVHRVDLPSQEAGAGWSTPFSRNNAFGSYYNCNNIARLLWLDTAHADRVLNTALQPDQQDIKIVLVNDGRYGGGGGNYATSSARSGDIVNVILHELGHSFAGLADEYTSQGYPCGNTGVEPEEPNVTSNASRDNVKWRDFSDAGLFEGAKYCERGLFRPYENSKMRALNGQFYALHIDAFRRRIMSIVKSGDSDSGDDSSADRSDGSGSDGGSEPASTDPLREFRYRGGSFVNTKGVEWEARKDNGQVNRFSEVSRDTNYIYIRDAARNLYLGLPIYAKTDWFFKFIQSGRKFKYVQVKDLP